MHHTGSLAVTDRKIADYVSDAVLPSQQEILGNIVVEIIQAGKHLNRKAICTRLLRGQELATTGKEKQRYQTLIGMLFEQ
ncbi:Biofilm development protein YmgB/AriR [Izhakiella capsodis]|uniref:Biofilm development protein YmgB/AriR n=1 Tax=Izhakiella capsodis TaxID=1367852 RepID=A0A1I4W117_9GAMM|nr:regulatory protein YcgZ [Izhakiella capsodis]SFN07007.1 Biofilm development protein YmgB/AriR [Izhakiella capsodis]